MLTYEYACAKCGHTFEAFQSMLDKPLSRCPKCKSSIRRVINGGMGTIFKGSGFYSTDNKKGTVLSGGNGGSSKEPSKDKEKAPEKPKEASTDKGSSDKGSSEKTSTEKKAAS